MNQGDLLPKDQSRPASPRAKSESQYELRARAKVAESELADCTPKNAHPGPPNLTAVHVNTNLEDRDNFLIDPSKW